jgi:hypothetical protein
VLRIVDWGGIGQVLSAHWAVCDQPVRPPTPVPSAQRPRLAILAELVTIATEGDTFRHVAF